MSFNNPTPLFNQTLKVPQRNRGTQFKLQPGRVITNRLIPGGMGRGRLMVHLGGGFFAPAHPALRGGRRRSKTTRKSRKRRKKK